MKNESKVKTIGEIVYYLKEFKELYEKGNPCDDFNLDRISYLVSGMWKKLKHHYYDDVSHGQEHIFGVMEKGFKILEWYLINNNILNLHYEERKHIIFSKDEKVNGLQVHTLFVMIGLAAIIHDVYQSKDRKNHHIMAEELCDFFIKEKVSKKLDISSKDLYFFLPDFVFMNVGYMCKQHRASYNGEFRNVLCEIFSAADRDRLDLKQIIQRSYSYTKKKKEVQPRRFILIEINGTEYSVNKLLKDLKANDWEQEKIEVFYHIIDKFSKVGYMFTNIKPDGIFMEYYKNDIQKFWDEIDYLITHPLSFDSYLK